MKQLALTFLFSLAFSSLVIAQAPQSFKYQAVVRNADNLIVAGEPVGIQLAILQGSVDGTPVYTETFAPTTNSYGLVNLEIGTGTSTDDFSAIDWSDRWALFY